MQSWTPYCVTMLLAPRYVYEGARKGLGKLPYHFCTQEAELPTNKCIVMCLTVKEMNGMLDHSVKQKAPCQE